MQIAILILTYKRLDLLKKCLESIYNQNNHSCDYKIYICVNGDDPETKNYIEAVKNKFNLNPLFNTDQKPVGEARNALISIIKEDWICFLDDDVYLPQNYFQIAFEIIQKEKELDIFGGPDQNTSNSSVFQKTLSLVMENYLATGPTNKRHRSDGNEIIKGDEVNLILCNFWAKRNVFKIKLFPENFRRNEENYLLAILKDHGVQMKYVPNLVVHHFRKSSLYKLIRVLYLAGQYRMVSLVYYPKSFKPIFLLHLFSLGILLIIAFYQSSLLLYLIFTYIVIVGLISMNISYKVQSIKGFIYSFLLFLIFHFVYPVGQLHGCISAINYKRKGFQF